MLTKSALREWRIERGLTLEAAAGHVGVSRKTFWRWEQGDVPAEKVLRLEVATGISRFALRPDLARIFVPTGDRAA